jgi:ADP-ribose pyrophosphatase YjhB (NUDIX family)
MTKTSFRRNLALFLRHRPWLVDSARLLWRLRQAHFTVGAVGVVFNSAGELLLVEHVFHPYFPWGLPGGWVDADEEPAVTVQRELYEELELEVVVGPLLLAAVDHPRHLDLAYACDLTGSVGKLSAEVLDCQWVAVSELPALHTFQRRAIEQALSIRDNSQ